MDERTATFEIESKHDARAVERLLNALYDTVREESRTVRSGTSDSDQMLAEFRAVRDAARTPAPGRLTVVYEQRSEGFDESGSD